MTAAERSVLRIDARDPETRRRVGSASVEPESRPTRVEVVGRDGSRELFLDWEGALDDSGRLRSCMICGCESLYRRRSLPSVTPYVLVIAFAAIGVSLRGYDDPRLLAALCVLLVIDVALLVLARHQLVCYRCGSRFEGPAIARQHRSWDRGEAQRHRRTDT